MKHIISIPLMIFINIIFTCITFTSSWRENTPGPYYIGVSIVFIIFWAVFTLFGDTTQLKFARIAAILIIICSVYALLYYYDIMSDFVEDMIRACLVLPIIIFELAFMDPLSGIIRNLYLPNWTEYILLIAVSVIWIYVCNIRLKRLK